MTEYLLNPDLLIMVSIISTAVWAVFFQKAVRTMPAKRFILTVVLCAIALAIELYAVASTFGLQSTPAGAYYILFACNGAVLFTVMNWKRRGAIAYGALAFLSSLALLAVSVNDYYQYFPSFGSIAFSHRKNLPITANLTAHQHYGQAGTSIEKMLSGNGPEHGSIISTDIPGTLSRFKGRSAYIYLPPAYSNEALANVKFPVLVMLSGTPGTPTDWLRGGQLSYTMDSFASHHKGIAPIVVIPDHTGSVTNDTECIDSPRGNADTYLTKDVPAFIKSNYRVSTIPQNWGIGGLSEGGMCAAMLTLKHQDTYRHFMDLSGDPFPYLSSPKQTLSVLFQGSKQAQQASNIDWLLDHQQISPDLTAQFAVGANDNGLLVVGMRHTYSLAVRRKIPSSFESIAHEGHSFAAWAHGFSNALPKMSFYLGATDCETSCNL